MSLEDIKILANQILRTNQIFSRHTTQELPTTLMILHEELDMKKNAINIKILEAD